MASRILWLARNLIRNIGREIPNSVRCAIEKFWLYPRHRHHPKEAMKFRVGTKVRVVRLLDKLGRRRFLQKVGRVMLVDEEGYHVLLDDWPDEDTFEEGELEKA